VSITGIITTYLILRLLVVRGFFDTYPARSHLRAQVLTVIDASRTLLWLPSGLDVGVGVFPQRKKIFVGGQRLWHEIP
jgi:hypothetical protein